MQPSQLVSRQQITTPGKFSQTRTVMASPLRGSNQTTYFTGGFHNTLSGAVQTTSVSSNNVFKAVNSSNRLLMSPSVNSSYLHPVRTSVNSNSQAPPVPPPDKNLQIEALVQENLKLVSIINDKNELLQKQEARLKGPSGEEIMGQSSLAKENEELRQQLKEEQEQYLSFKTKAMLVITENENLQTIYV